MEIIFVCTRSITFNTFLKSQAKYLLKKGYKVKVVCSDIENLHFDKSLAFKVNFPTGYTSSINIFKYYKIYLQIKEIINKNKLSIFYLHTPVASFIFRFFSFFDNLKILYFVHGFRFTKNSNFIFSLFFKTIEKVLSTNTNIYITINDEDFNFANNFFEKKLIYKINGVGLDIKKLDLNKFKKKEGIKKILVIGAYKKSKGYLDYLEIAKFLNKKKFIIDCFGYGEKYKYINLKTKNKLNNISFNNFDENLKNKIETYDILLHLSKREGLPVSVMESLARGLPVICKKIRGNEDLIDNGKNGFFIKSNKDAANKIFFLDLNKEFFNNMRFNAYKSINKNFSKQSINNKIYKIIKKHF